jgi:isopentenyl diphosphate isomerase/L-lactate dehydrogenase-like FMN-dependent dehydrogenase
MESETALDAWIEQWLLELRTALFLTGSRTPADLRGRPRVILGDTRSWIDGLTSSLV